MLQIEGAMKKFDLIASREKSLYYYLLVCKVAR